MDFLDPIYRRRHIIRLYVGYVLIASAILLAVILLLLVAKGYELNRNGEIVQKGFLFASSRPAGADVYLDGVATNKLTNARFNIPAGNYALQLKRDGYRSWQHHVRVIGNSVVRYDYPVLFPEILDSSVVKGYGANRPGMATETLDGRWLLVQPEATLPTWNVFDLNATQITSSALTLPARFYTAGGRQSWQAVTWATDDTHVLIKHGYGTKGAYEFILLNRESPSQSVNLNNLMGSVPTSVRLRDGKFNQYYVYFASTQKLKTASIETPAPQSFLSNVLEYEPYKADTVLYVTPSADDKTQALVQLRRGDQIYTLRRLTLADTYRIAISDYSSKLYVAVSDPAKKIVAIYKDPLAQIGNSKIQTAITPLALLHITAPNFLSFSATGRFVVAELGGQFAAYDNEYKQDVTYTMTQPLDRGQTHATWMDGAHLQYVTNKQLYVFDYDGANAQLLMPALDGAKVFYDDAYKVAYALASSGSGKDVQYILTSTPLLTPADQ